MWKGGGYALFAVMDCEPDPAWKLDDVEDEDSTPVELDGSPWKEDSS